MGRVIYSMSMSVDGLIAGPDRSLDWHRVDEELHAYFNDELAAMGAFLHGREMYELMAAYWPTAGDDPEAPPVMVDFSRIWLEKPKFVYSTTLAGAEWNTTLVREVVPDEVRRLAAELGDMVVGGADLAAEFLRLGLVDEIRCYVHPTVVGQGMPMFRPEQAPLDLRLTETRTFGNGVVLLRYDVER